MNQRLAIPEGHQKLDILRLNGHWWWLERGGGGLDDNSIFIGYVNSNFEKQGSIENIMSSTEENTDRCEDTQKSISWEKKEVWHIYKLQSKYFPG